MELHFSGRVIEWRGPSPFYFVPVPEQACADIRAVAVATYRWGVIPAEAHIGEVTFGTSLFPKDGGYLLPLRAAVRRPDVSASTTRPYARLRRTTRLAGMQIYLFGGPSHGERLQTNEPFEEGDKLTWTPQGDVTRIAGPFSNGGYIINENNVEVDGLQRRTAIWRE